MTTTATELKRCDCCAIEKPLSEFRLRRREFADRAADCRRCHADAERHRRFRKRARKFVHSARQIAQADDVARIRQLASRLLEKLGSPRRVADQYHQIIQAKLATDPASPDAATMLLGILRLNVLSKSLTTTEPLPETLDAKRAALGREFSKFILEKPGEIAELLCEIGWTAIPPHELSINSI